MPDKLEHCEDCQFFFPICKRETMSVCKALPYVGVFIQRHRRQILAGIGLALKQHGICALHTEIVDGANIACDEIYPYGD